MAMEEALVTRFAGVSAIAAIAGANIAWFERPRVGGLPALTIDKVTPGSDWTMSGPDGLDGPRIQTDCWASSDAEAVALARAVRAEMERVDPVTVGGWIFHPASLEFERWSTERLDGDVKVFRVQQDFEFYHQAA